MQAAKIDAINTYFDTHICTEKETEVRLISDQRQDEAVFARIRGNVYSIFSAVFHTAIKSADDPFPFFLKKLADIPSSWQTALQQADAQGNWQSAHIERIKLETAGTIQRDIQRLWEVDYDGK